MWAGKIDSIAWICPANICDFEAQFCTCLSKRLNGMAVDEVPIAFKDAPVDLSVQTVRLVLLEVVHLAVEGVKQAVQPSCDAPLTLQCHPVNIGMSTMFQRTPCIVSSMWLLPAATGSLFLCWMGQLEEE